MLFVNLKITKRRAVFFSLVLMLCVGFACCVGFMNENKPQNDSEKITDKSDIVRYLDSFGIEAGEITVDKITVPHMFGEVYYSYNKIQESQGFDLSDFKGEILTRYTAEVLNYPDYSEGVFAEVLVHNKEIVGVDIYSVSADGFIMALK